MRIHASSPVVAGFDAALRDAGTAYRRWQAMLDEDGIGHDVATLVRLAMDGWWLAAFADLAPPDPATGRAIRARIEELIAAAPPG